MTRTRTALALLAALAVAGMPLASIIPAIIALGLLLALHESRPARETA